MIDREKEQQSKSLIKYLQECFRYKPVPITLEFGDVRKTFRDLLPEWCLLNGNTKNKALFSKKGKQIASGYERIVIGDYGAYVEFSTDQACEDVFICQPGQEYRQEERYKHCKYLWMTTNDDSDIKIYKQQHTVSYADYRPGMYYVSVYDVQPESET